MDIRVIRIRIDSPRLSLLVIALAVGQVKFLEADEFNLEFFDLLEGETGEAGWQMGKYL
jgi:hypothetical protein